MHKLTWIISIVVALFMVDQLGSAVLAQSVGPDMRVEQLLRKLEQLSGSQTAAPRAKARLKGKVKKRFRVKVATDTQCPTSVRLSGSHFGVDESYGFGGGRPIDLSGGKGTVILIVPYDFPNAETDGDIFVTAQVIPNCTNANGGPLNVPEAFFQVSSSIPMPPDGGTTTLDDSIIVLSDIRLKRDIAQVGRLASGLKLYRYRYRWSDTEYVGVMAQEVAAVMPEAVLRGSDGYLRVDYARLGLNVTTWDEWRRTPQAGVATVVR